MLLPLRARQHRPTYLQREGWCARFEELAADVAGDARVLGALALGVEALRSSEDRDADRRELCARSVGCLRAAVDGGGGGAAAAAAAAGELPRLVVALAGMDRAPLAARRDAAALVGALAERGGAAAVAALVGAGAARRAARAASLGDARSAGATDLGLGAGRAAAAALRCLARDAGPSRDAVAAEAPSLLATIADCGDGAVVADALEALARCAMDAATRPRLASAGCVKVAVGRLLRSRPARGPDPAAVDAAACGCLANLCLEPAARDALVACDGVRVLAAVARDAAGVAVDGAGNVLGAHHAPRDWAPSGGTLGAAALALRNGCLDHAVNRDRAVKTGAVVGLVAAGARGRVDAGELAACVAALRVLVGDAPAYARVLREARGHKVLAQIRAGLDAAGEAGAVDDVDALLKVHDRAFGPDPARPPPPPKPAGPRPTGAHWGDPKEEAGEKAWDSYQAAHGRASRFPQYHADEPPAPPPPAMPQPPLPFRPPRSTPGSTRPW